jgi:membrane-associated phospholipid phosphatase
MKKQNAARPPLQARIAFFVLLLAVSPGAFGLELGLDPLGDSIALGGGLCLAGASEFLFQAREVPETGLLDATEVNGFDRLAMYAYSRGPDVVSTILQYATAAAPVFFSLFLDLDDTVTAGVIYLESLSYAFFAKNTLKYLFPRQRPWTYFEGTSDSMPDERSDSFPSGHATIAFAAATCGIFLFNAYFPDSPYLIPFVAADLSVAFLTSAFRVVSGMHFMSDVIAGAALGTAIGLLVPYLHRTSGVGAGSPQSVKRMSTEIPLVKIRY